jgi:chemotaxis protein methyltransferase CheR
MRADDFNLFQSLLKQRSGLVLTMDKAYLLESRLMPVARKWHFKGIEELAASVRSKREERLLRDITEAMTTNESSFFRDTKPFEQFRQFVLPALLTNRAGQKRIRIWSAACSSGQEAYSLAIVLQEEKARLAGWTVEIVGTDISSEMLEKAKAGRYTQFEVQRGLPISYLVKHFRQTGDKWEISPELRRMVTFKEWNLLKDLSPLGQFDVVFCRNVLIYFDQPTKTLVLEAIAKLIPPDGVLYLGGAETVLGITDKFKPVDGQRGIYQLSNSAYPSGARAPSAGMQKAAVAG